MSETILIVDDETNLRKTLAEILRARGYATLEASDGAEAIELLRDAVPGLIFTDWKMPSVGGEEVLRHVRSNQRLESVPVIVITAFGSSHSAIEAVRLGAYDFVTKPFDLEEIAFTAKRALAHSSLDRELTQLRAQAVNGNSPAAGRLIGSSGAMMDVFKMVGKVAETDSNGPDLRRVRHWQGACCRGRSQLQPAKGKAVCGGQLCGHSRAAPGI